MIRHSEGRNLLLPLTREVIIISMDRKSKYAAEVVNTRKSDASLVRMMKPNFTVIGARMLDPIRRQIYDILHWSKRHRNASE